MLGLGVEECVADAEVVMTAHLEEALAIFIHLASSKVSKARRPGALVGANPGVEVTEDE